MKKGGKEKTSGPAPTWLSALGSQGLPARIRAGNEDYQYLKTFKHDFFAATGLYVGSSGKVVLKMGRQANLFGLPMDWIGRLLTRHESRLYQATQSIAGIPRFVGFCGPSGFVHEYIEGHPLARDDQPDDHFFPRLRAMLDEMHARDTAYVDLEKRENVILSEDGSPYLIDFQIAWHIPENRGGRTWVNRCILKILQRSDHYHLMKHWRRLRPDQLEGQAIAESYAAPFWIRWHRAIFRPLTQLRRRILVRLGARSSAAGRSPG